MWRADVIIDYSLTRLKYRDQHLLDNLPYIRHWTDRDDIVHNALKKPLENDMKQDIIISGPAPGIVVTKTEAKGGGFEGARVLLYPLVDVFGVSYQQRSLW